MKSIWDSDDSDEPSSVDSAAGLAITALQTSFGVLLEQSIRFTICRCAVLATIIRVVMPSTREHKLYFD